MKTVLIATFLCATGLVATSCNNLPRTNENYAAPYHRNAGARTFRRDRSNDFSAPGTWHVHEAGGSTAVGFVN